jgi:hypothetical protein
MVWTILNDPLKRIAKFIYHRISHIAQSISDLVWKDMKQYTFTDEDAAEARKLEAEQRGEEPQQYDRKKFH